jgi:alpha-glucosidase
MPVMQYIHEKQNYPVSLEVFPGNVNQEATFTLYEDDGESREYENDTYCKTTFTCLTIKEGFKFTINGREYKGFKPTNKSNYIVKIHTAIKPKVVTINAIKAKKK